VTPEDIPIRLQRVTFWGSTLLSTAQRRTEPNVNMREPKVLKKKSIKVLLLYCDMTPEGRNSPLLDNATLSMFP
jgi:hypothetical protein